VTHRSLRLKFLDVVALAGAVVGVTAGVAAGTSGLLGASESKSQSPFDWFKPGPPPAGWKQIALPSAPAVLSYPPRFQLAHTDPGTATAEVLDRAGTTIGYLNATPRQGTETLANWSDFRINHQHAEERSIREEARVLGLAFRGGTGSCVIDRYLTPLKHHSYREIACYVVGDGKGSVIVAAAPTTLWKAAAKELEQAVSAYDVR
jgi:hypothetical protein